MDYFVYIRPAVEERLRYLEVPIDITQEKTGVAGHSRGGKVSALIGTSTDLSDLLFSMFCFLEDTNLVKTMFLIDPVDNVRVVQHPSAKYPSAVDALNKGNFQLGIAGEISLLNASLLRGGLEVQVLQFAGFAIRPLMITSSFMMRLRRDLG